MSEVEFLRGFVTERLTAVSQEILAAVDRVVAGYEAEASGFRQEIERQKNMLNVLLQPRVVLNKTGDQHPLIIEVEDQDNPESLHVKEEKEELSTTPEFPLTSVHVKSEDEEEELQSLQPHQRQTEAEPPSSSSAEQIEADGDDCGGSEPARNSDQHEDLQLDPNDKVSGTSCETEGSDDRRETRAPESGLNSEAVHVSDIECDTGKKSHRCPACGKILSKASHLKRHLRVHTGEKPFDCATCGKRFSQRWSLKLHMRIHSGEKPFDRTSESGLNSEAVHVSDAECDTGKKSHRCSECGRTFISPSALKMHMMIHTGEKPFDRTSESGLNSEAVHVSDAECDTGKKSHRCSECGRTFISPSALKMHMMIHTGEKPFDRTSESGLKTEAVHVTDDEECDTGKKSRPCPECGKTFTRVSYLRRHMRLQTGEKPFDCVICDKTFRLRCHRYRHRRIQTGEKPFDRIAESGLKTEAVHVSDGECDPSKKSRPCPECGRTFTRVSDLRRHVRVHTGEKPFDCAICAKTFRLRCHRYRHMGIQTGWKPFDRIAESGLNSEAVHVSDAECDTGKKSRHCSECGGTFTRVSDLRRHVRVHTGEKPYYCAICGKTFRLRCHRYRHTRIQTEGKPFDRIAESGLNSEAVHVSDAECDTGKKSHSCSECGKTFRSPSVLKIHMRSHTGEKPFDCATCGKTFSRRTSLKDHMKVHTGEKPFDCTTCGKAFIRRYNLIVHMRIHRGENTGKKSHRCSECGKTFNVPSGLKRHVRVHTGENTGKKSHRCSECGKTFNAPSRLKRHVRVHTGENTGKKSHLCSECGKTFNKAFSLKIHMMNHRGEKRFDCATCGKKFNYHQGLKVHMRIHTGEKPFLCPTCGKQFRHLVSLKIHLKLHAGERPFSCAVCGKRFSQKTNLLAHNKVHSKEKPFGCSVCGETFMELENLATHMKSHKGGNFQVLS